MDKFTSIMKSGAKQCAVFFHKCNSKPGFRSLIAALISVFVGLFCGFLLMLCVSPQYSGVGFWTLISAGFSSASLFDLAVYRAIPMILSGELIRTLRKTPLRRLHTSRVFPHIWCRVAELTTGLPPKAGNTIRQIRLCRL